MYCKVTRLDQPRDSRTYLYRTCGRARGAEWVAAFSTLRHDAVPPFLRFAFILMSLVNVSVRVVGNDAPQRFSIDDMKEQNFLTFFSRKVLPQ